MPEKPIKPDRVRLPAECRRANLIHYTLGIWVFPAAVIILGRPIPSISIGLKWILIASITTVFMGGTLAYTFIANSRWRKRVREHNGLLCPQCTYPLAAIQESQARVTCPECGYMTLDTAKLHDRWNKTLKPDAFRIGIRLGKDAKQNSGD